MIDTHTLTDRFGRVHTSVRISVTDRCNLRCAYCMPAKGMKFLPRAEVLDFEDLAFAAKVLASLGVKSVRISGGEPLVRKDLPEFVRMLREAGTTKVAMTTNALLLKRHAAELKDAGLDRLNISLDSLDPRRFEKITRNGHLQKAWEGLEEAIAVGFSPIKINTLVLKGFNEDEIEQWVELVQERELIVRFMELMPIGEDDLKDVGSYFDLTALRKELMAKHGLVPATDTHVGNGPAKYWKAPGWKGALGFITPMSQSYCATCSRLRLTCTGKLRACLAYDEDVDLGPALRARDENAVRELILKALAEKKAGHPWNEGVRTIMGMSEIGG